MQNGVEGGEGDNIQGMCTDDSGDSESGNGFVERSFLHGKLSAWHLTCRQLCASHVHC